MADGLKIVLPVTFQNASGLDILRDDAILSSGSLILIDPIHSQNPLVGVPANNAAIPNIAWKEAAALIGSGTQSSLASTFVDAHQSVDAIFERSSKGGLHGIYSQTNNVNTRGAIIQTASAIRDYIFTNRAHSFYFSVTGRRTRVAITTGGALPRMSSIFQTAIPGSYIENFDPAATAGAGTTDTYSTGDNVVGNFFRAARGTGFTTSDPANSAALTAAPWMWGNPTPGATAWTNKAASDIMYRFYCEDLTVSGRSFATVQALDLSLYTGFLATGGKFNGDTFTAPSTFP